MDHGITIAELDACSFSNRHGTYGGQAGMKDGILYHGENWLVKYPKTTRGMDVRGLSYTTAPLSEYIGSHIYQILGYDTHETLLARRNGKLVVACRDFRADDEMLIEIRTIKNAANQQLAEKLDRDFSETGDKHMINLEELLLHLEHNDILKKVDGIRERFWDCMIVDILINNNDRNNGNWGILRQTNGHDRLAPVFDNGACFSNKVSDERIQRLLCSPQAILSSALNTVTGFAYGEKILTAKKALELDFPELRDAVLRVVPKIRENMGEIKAFLGKIPEQFDNLAVCSRERAIFYEACMDCRMEHLLEPCYAKQCGKTE